MGCTSGPGIDPVRERFFKLRDCLKNVSLSYFTAGELEDLMILLGLHRNIMAEICDEATLAKFEKIADDFEKGVAR